MIHQHNWNIIDKKHDNIKRMRSHESEMYTVSKCDCGATKTEYRKIIVQEVPNWLGMK